MHQDAELHEPLMLLFMIIMPMNGTMVMTTPLLVGANDVDDVVVVRSKGNAQLTVQALVDQLR